MQKLMSHPLNQRLNRLLNRLLHHKITGNPTFLLKWERKIAGIGLLILLAGCSKAVDDATQIRQAITAIETAIENRDRQAVMDYLADDFSGQQGSYDRNGANRLILAHFLQHKQIRVLVTGVEVTIHPDPQRATTVANALVTGSAHWLPEQGRSLTLTLGWRKAGSEWQIVNSHWQ